MTMDVDADIDTEPTSVEMTGVIGVNEATTRTEATLPVLLLEQLVADQSPVGAPPLGSHRVLRLAAVITANGLTIRFAAARMWVRSAATFAGQTGPPVLPQPGSAWPIQLASTAASRAPSRAAWDRTLCW